MDIKLTKQFQKKLELLLESQEYKIRFEKGNFKSGYCIIRNKKVIIVNKYFTPSLLALSIVSFKERDIGS